MTYDSRVGVRQGMIDAVSEALLSHIEANLFDQIGADTHTKVPRVLGRDLPDPAPAPAPPPPTLRGEIPPL